MLAVERNHADAGSQISEAPNTPLEGSAPRKWGGEFERCSRCKKQDPPGASLRWGDPGIRGGLLMCHYCPSHARLGAGMGEGKFAGGVVERAGPGGDLDPEPALVLEGGRIRVSGTDNDTAYPLIRFRRPVSTEAPPSPSCSAPI
ncbi:hypothetical protein P7K49_034650 [Saguinus oedipus]|uniref:GATA-type domain-containing protein n=1 Tax=Saguinus oedipus TaxID=9490 RepID=A0ABQ9TVB4_SAGOE|nr:hypothetical protein P7K49_034650 [Saguinus oedipus]